MNDEQTPSSHTTHPGSSPAPSISRRPAWLGWGAALALVIVAWAAAVAYRGGGTKAELTGWEPGIEAGQEKAQELDRPMLLMFTADWCEPCQRVKREILTQPEVQDVLMQQYVPVTVDMTNAGRSDTRLGQYGVQGYPTLIVVNTDGTQLARASGAGVGPLTDTQTFLDWLDEARP